MELEELRANLGQEVAVSEWFAVTQERIDAFARVTEDAQWIHVDPDRASGESPYAATIAHGFLTLSLLSFLSREAVEIRGDFRMRINYGLNRVRFPAAVKSGARVRARFVPQAVRDVPGSVEIVWGVTVEIEAQPKPACVAEWVTRLYYQEKRL
jgi:acyl dehydratase